MVLRSYAPVPASSSPGRGVTSARWSLATKYPLPFTTGGTAGIRDSGNGKRDKPNQTYEHAGISRNPCPVSRVPRPVSRVFRVREQLSTDLGLRTPPLARPTTK
jgi:hypothetical protein